MPRLSIIIPTQGNWQALETTLVSVLENRPPQSEVLVVLNQAYDDPYDLCGEIRFIEAPRRAALVELVNTGFAAARCELLHVLACGATVCDGWTDLAVRHFDDPRVAAVAPLVLDAASPGRVLTAGCTWSRGGNRTSYGAGLGPEKIGRAGDLWVGPELAAGFYRRSALAEVAALDVTLVAELAAVDLGRRLLQSGRRTVLETACLVTMAPELVSPSPSWAEAWHCERLFWRDVGGSGATRKLAAHAGLVALEVLRCTARPSAIARAVGRLLGVCDRRRARRADLPAAITAQATRAVDAERRVDAAHETRSSERAGMAHRRSVRLSSREERS